MRLARRQPHVDDDIIALGRGHRLCPAQELAYLRLRPSIRAEADVDRLGVGVQPVEPQVKVQIILKEPEPPQQRRLFTFHVLDERADGWTRAEHEPVGALGHLLRHIWLRPQDHPASARPPRPSAAANRAARGLMRSQRVRPREMRHLAGPVCVAGDRVWNRSSARRLSQRQRFDDDPYLALRRARAIHVREFVEARRIHANL